MTHQANLRTIATAKVQCWCCREDVIPHERPEADHPFKQFCPSCEAELYDGRRPLRPAIGTIAATMALARALDRNTAAHREVMGVYRELLDVQREGVELHRRALHEAQDREPN